MMAITFRVIASECVCALLDPKENAISKKKDIKKKQSHTHACVNVCYVNIYKSMCGFDPFLCFEQPILLYAHIIHAKFD